MGVVLLIVCKVVEPRLGRTVKIKVNGDGREANGPVLLPCCPVAGDAGHSGRGLDIALIKPYCDRRRTAWISPAAHPCGLWSGPAPR